LISLEKAKSSTMGKRHTVHIEEFIDGLKSDKLCGFRDHEYTIVEDWNLGFRLDHQGKNSKAGTKAHRLYIQPVAWGKTPASKKSHGKVLANIHCDDPEDVDKVKAALKESAGNAGDLVVV